MAFSGDGYRLASVSGDYTVKIWDLAISNYLQTIIIGILLANILFDFTNSYLLIKIKCFKVDRSPRPRVITLKASAVIIITTIIGGLALD